MQGSSTYYTYARCYVQGLIVVVAVVAGLLCPGGRLIDHRGRGQSASLLGNLGQLQHQLLVLVIRTQLAQLQQLLLLQMMVHGMAIVQQIQLLQLLNAIVIIALSRRFVVHALTALYQQLLLRLQLLLLLLVLQMQLELLLLLLTGLKFTHGSRSGMMIG